MPDPNPLRDPETRERLLAEAHTAGDYPWFIADGDDLNYDTGEPYMHTDAPTAAHIANWSPATALAALELIGELEAKNAELRVYVEENIGCNCDGSPDGPGTCGRCLALELPR